MHSSKTTEYFGNMEDKQANNLSMNMGTAEIEAMSTGDIKRIIGELHEYQSELEMKNKALTETVSTLQKTQKKYDRLYDFAPIGYATLDKKAGTMSDLNLALTQLLGVERSALKGKRFAQFVALEHKDNFQEFLKNIFDSRHKNMCELFLQPKNGKPFLVRLEGVDIEEDTSVGRCCQIAVIDIDERKRMEEELDRQVRQRTAELEHTNALLIGEIEERKKWQKDSELLINELQNAIHDAETREKAVAETHSEMKTTETPTLTQQEVLKMKLKEFCDSQIDTVYGSRFWRFVVNSKKSYEPMFPMHELMEYTVQDFCDDMRCRLRIKKHYNNDTLEKAIEAFSKYGLSPFGSNN